MSHLVFVTAPDCHLCEHGREVLDALEVERREISAESDEAARLAARGIPLAFLPVLTDGASVIGYGRLSEKRLRKELVR